MNIYHLDLDLDKRSALSNETGGLCVVIRQGDTSGTQLSVDFYDHGEPFTSAATVYFAMELPDKSHYYRTQATYSNGTATVTLDEAYAASVVGRTGNAYFEVHANNVIASTSSFSVIVLPSATSGKAEGQSYDDEVIATIRAWLDEHPEATTTVTDGSISTVKLADGSVTTPKLAADAVITEKIADSQVTSQKLANSAVTSAKIAAGAVSDDKLDPDGVLRVVNELVQQMETMDVTIDPDDLGLEQDSDTGYVYPTYRGVRSENGIPLAASGGGGGGSGNAAVITMTNTTGWLSGSVSYGSSCVLTLTWSSLEQEVPTGDGSLSVTVNGISKLAQTVHQGGLSIDVGPYLAVGTNKVKVRVADVYDNARTVTFTISAVELRIGSSFDTSGVFTAGQPIDYTYTPVGAVEKTVYFVVDGQTEDIATVTTSGRQQTQSLRAMSHGAHSLLVYFTAEVDGQMVRSNELNYSLVVVDPSSNLPIVSTAFVATTATQYETLRIPYTVYTPNSLTSQVTLSANGTQVASLTVDRSEQTWAYRCDSTGQLTLTIQTGTISKTLSLTVAESDIDAHAETENLALHLTSYGRSNNEAHPEAWEDDVSGVSCTLTGFNFVSDGWVTDDDGITVLRVANDARVTIPYQPFATDFRSTGKTLEFEFATRDVYDYDATVISCWSGNRGLKLTAQAATLASEQSSISMQYKEDEHVRVSFVAEKRTEDRLLMLYINGIMSGVIQYPDDDNFSQQNPVGISIGSNGCATDIYNIRVYDNDLTRYQILDNWIADTQDVGTMLDRYTHNDVYDEYGAITIDNLPSDLPYMVIECPELPQYKGDKKTVSGYYVDPVDASKSFSFTGCQMNVQGTSSAPYYRKNWDLQFKNGFEMTQSGEHASTYALNDDVISFNRFVLKADVASSEGANNVELVRLFCDAAPYKRPEEVANPKVRKGIDGHPIVMFWHDTANNRTTFYSKSNFNLPKRAPEPYGYTGDMESWEFQNNTSNLMLFLSDYFSEAPLTDPDTGETKATWRYDYEARFPDDSWVDYQKLQEFQSFVYSTYRAGATGNALSTPVTYQETHVVYDEVTDPDTGAISYVERVVTEDVTYTTDTAAYRLSRFRNEFPKYAEVDSFVFYYLFTELFLMVDSRAKNLFIGFSGGPATGLQHIDRKAVAEPYDMDTAAGTNNEGSLVFGYSLEDTDHVNNADVFNGQNSVLWNNVRDAFGPEITAMYQSLRSSGALSYDTVMARFEEHQSKWPEAVFNEDAWSKYIGPLISPDSGKEPTAVYLPMAQGSKAEQRKWWLYNRFRYMDSRWNAGDARSDVIQLRGYAKADITVTPYADIYPTVRYGSYTVSARGTHGVATTLACPLDNVNDTEIYVYSAPQIASVGDLSPLRVGFADFSKATRLQSIKVGSSASGYSNPNLTALSVGTNQLLRSVDARNCTALSGALNLSGAGNIEHVYLDGTRVTSVSLPVGGILKTLSLPATIANLTVRNQSSLTTFSMQGGDYSSITTLRVENTPTIPVLDILDEMTANSRVRIIGFSMTVQTTQDVEDFFDALDLMQGLDEAGNTVSTAVVSGEITGLGTITGAWLAQMNARYPDVTIRYEHINSTLSYYSWDGSTLVTTETVADGGNGTYSGQPARTSTAQYSYAFVGWSRYTDQTTADPTATQGVTADRSVYAAYTATVRTYTVTWKNADGTTLETDLNVPYGTMPSYDGVTPTYQGETSTGWTPTPAAIEGDTTYTALYIPTYVVRFYSGISSSSQGTLLQTSQVQEGSYASYTGETPTSPDGSYMQFTGWDKALGPIYAATDLYAQYRDTRDVLVQYVEGTMTTYDGSATTIAPYAFQYRESLTTVETNATSIGSYAFRGCTSLESVDAASATTVGVYAFQSCKSLEAADLSSVTTLQNYVFDGCAHLSDLTTGTLTTINQYALQKCKSLTTDSLGLSSVTSVGNYAFSESGVGKLALPAATTVGTYTGRGTRTSVIDLGKSIVPNGNKFNAAWALCHLVMRGVTSVVSLTTSALTNTAIAAGKGWIYVPDDLVSSYQSATNWSTYASQIVALSEYPKAMADETISDTWTEINANANYATEYSVGDIKYLDVGGTQLAMVLVAKDADTLAAGGTARMTWLSRDMLATFQMNPTDTTAGGWAECDLRNWLREVVYPQIESGARSAIKEVAKTYALTSGTQSVTDTVWIPSAREMFGGSSYESSGCDYTAFFADNASRIKKQGINGSAPSWWLRSATNATSFRNVNSSGNANYISASTTYGVVLGFSI